MLASKQIGQGGDQHRGGMRRHVPATGGQGRRATERTGRDLHHHHRDRDGDDDPGSPFIAAVMVAKEHMLMRGSEAGGYGGRFRSVLTTSISSAAPLARALSPSCQGWKRVPGCDPRRTLRSGPTRHLEWKRRGWALRRRAISIQGTAGRPRSCP